MGVVAVLGAQWGDEGKGKISQVLSDGHQICARYQGGSNAGHTIVLDDGRELIFRQVPCGILSARSGLLAGGMAVNPIMLMAEAAMLRGAVGLDVTKKLWIARNAHVVLPAYIDEERSSATSSAVGTTGNGIGPTYREKAARQGMRIADLTSNPEALLARLNTADCPAFRAFIDAFSDRIVDGRALVRISLDAGGSAIAEGGQGALLDLDHGEYPYVTSSSTTIGGVLTGLGVGPKDVEAVYLIAAIYMTKVGGGQLPTRMEPILEAAYQVAGREVDGATRKLRQCGWLDLDALAYACSVNQPDHLVLTRLDVPAEIGVLRVRMPGGALRCISTQGWQPWISEGCVADPPEGAKRLLEMVESSTGVRVAAVSYGRRRSDLLWLRRRGVSG